MEDTSSRLVPRRTVTGYEPSRRTHDRKQHVINEHHYERPKSVFPPPSFDNFMPSFVILILGFHCFYDHKAKQNVRGQMVDRVIWICFVKQLCTLLCSLIKLLAPQCASAWRLWSSETTHIHSHSRYLEAFWTFKYNNGIVLIIQINWGNHVDRTSFTELESQPKCKCSTMG